MIRLLNLVANILLDVSGLGHTEVVNQFQWLNSRTSTGKPSPQRPRFGTKPNSHTHHTCAERQVVVLQDRVTIPRATSALLAGLRLPWTTLSCHRTRRDDGLVAQTRWRFSLSQEVSAFWWFKLQVPTLDYCKVLVEIPGDPLTVIMMLLRQELAGKYAKYKNI